MLPDDLRFRLDDKAPPSVMGKAAFDGARHRRAVRSRAGCLIR